MKKLNYRTASKLNTDKIESFATANLPEILVLMP